MKKTLLVFAWFPIMICMVVADLIMLTTIVHRTRQASVLSASAPQEIFQLTAAGGTSQVLNATVIAGDARVLLLQQFMARHQSPMTPFADIIVSEADKYGIDYRLVPAIAMCESNLGKRMPKKDEFNAFGIAVYSGQQSGKKFDSWVASIQWVSRYIKEHYYDRGYTDLYDIGAIWAPPSVENGYSWTNCVQGFMGSII